MIRFLEKNGYDVTYMTNVDTERRGNLITQHKVFMSVGHDEYWSKGSGTMLPWRGTLVNTSHFLAGMKCTGKRVGRTA